MFKYIIEDRSLPKRQEFLLKHHLIPVAIRRIKRFKLQAHVSLLGDASTLLTIGLTVHRALPLCLCETVSCWLRPTKNRREEA